MRRSASDWEIATMLTTDEQTINFEQAEITRTPFEYFTLPEAFGDGVSFEVLDWLEKSEPWKLIEADFYTQHEFDFAGVELPKQISFLYQAEFLDYLIEQFERLFAVRLARRVDLTAHKLTAGHTIRLHNDFLPGQETHRFIIQLNRGWQDENGGFLLLFNSSDPSDVHRILRPVHNSAVGFAISHKSNHAVSTVHRGERHTLVYSFYAADDDAA